VHGDDIFRHYNPPDALELGIRGRRQYTLFRLHCLHSLSLFRQSVCALVIRPMQRPWFPTAQ
jgi:hypothetical protein